MDAHSTELYLHSDHLIFLSNFGLLNDQENPYYGTWTMTTAGKGLIQLLDYCPNHIVAWGDIIYYTDRDCILNSMDFYGNHIKTYENIEVGSGLNINNEYTFYVDRDSDYICRTDHDCMYKYAYHRNGR